MERIIEDVVAVVKGDWEMMAAILVLELDAVRGVGGIGDFTVYVCDGDGCPGITFEVLDIVGCTRQYSSELDIALIGTTIHNFLILRVKQSD